MDLKYLLKIFIICFLILSILVFIYKNLLNVITIEGFDKSNIFISNSQAFCKFNKGFNLEEACNHLTESNCNGTSCCIWASKCRAGNAKGPLFNSNTNGKTIQLDKYYFQNKCYGSKCPEN